ncbi:hypothetical protein [Streptomyces sp. WAC08241]|uniref:hypothetical protein n=1 Tax=Streptomyces sp. WAC08241 TaxID=2487421 RepID=UPI000F774889|nr:hypothetical protein [Streptomyces sp. WAC08241]RSS46204.1 hypothetical protein EF906_02530 [Streptomyces sp. WAC08241]
MLAASTDEGTMIRLLGTLRDSVANSERDDEDLLAAIDMVLDPCHAPAPPTEPSAVGTLLNRLPYRRPRGGVLKAEPFSEEDVNWILFQFRRATTPAITRATVRGDPVLTGLIDRVRALHDRMAKEDDMVGYLRRYAQALLDLLDLTGDDAT